MILLPSTIFDLTQISRLLCALVFVIMLCVCEPFVLSCNKLMFVQSVKYLGIILLADKKIKYSIDHLKVKFYWVFNCIYCRSRGANSKLVSVEQQSNIYFAVKWISNLPLNTALLSYHITEINACLL